MNLNSTSLMLIGSIVVGVFGFSIKQWFTRFIDKKFENVYASQERNEKEREQDNYITMRGQQVTCDCLHHLSQAVLKGDHIEELEKANKELDDYRILLNRTLVEKAARHNINIER